VVVAASPNWTSSVHIRRCSIVYRREDGLSRLIHRSLAVDGVDVDSATHGMVVQCGGGGQLKLDLLSTHMRLVVSFVCDKMVLCFYPDLVTSYGRGVQDHDVGISNLFNFINY